MEPVRDEASYVAEARAGSERAWRYLVDAHQARLLRLAWALTGDRELATDLAQEAFIEAFVRIGQLRSDGAFGAWVRTILVRSARRSYRRRGQVPIVELEHRRTPDKEVLGQELRGLVDEAIAALPPLYREALAVAIDGEMTSAQAAEMLGCSPEAYRVRVHKARRALRRTLGNYLTE